MPRIGLPAGKSAAGSSSSVSPAAMLRVALGATAFRVISALVALFCAAAFSRSVGDAEPSTFGLYPVFTGQVDHWLGRWLATPVTAPLVVSWLMFAGAAAMLLKVAALDLDAERAEGAVLLAVVFPFASIFGQRVADALFLLAALGAFWGFRQQNWIAGGLAGAVATASMPTGIVIVPALAWIGFRSGGRRMRVVAALLLTVFGFLAYLSYLYYRAGPPGGWGEAMTRWGFHLGQAPWLPLTHLFTAPHGSQAPVEAANVGVTLIALASVPFVWWRLDGGYAIYMLAMLWFPLTSGKYDDLGRTCALLFPLFVLVASIRWRVVVMTIAVTSAMFYAIGLAL